MTIEGIFVYIGWLFIIGLFLGTLVIIFTDIFRKLTPEQRILFAIVSPAFIGYVVGSSFLGFTKPLAVIGVIGVLYLLVPPLFFYVHIKYLKE